ncbi:MAG TPA: hypothetical protein PKB02_02375 [Anaerohalosphaeraceae bacterium]|nr:hypothetical protein [Anaerohalosphaeraceae bacterium]
MRRIFLLLVCFAGMAWGATIKYVAPYSATWSATTSEGGDDGSSATNAGAGVGVGPYTLKEAFGTAFAADTIYYLTEGTYSYGASPNDWSISAKNGEANKSYFRPNASNANPVIITNSGTAVNGTIYLLDSHNIVFEGLTINSGTAATKSTAAVYLRPNSATNMEGVAFIGCTIISTSTYGIYCTNVSAAGLVSATITNCDMQISGTTHGLSTASGDCSSIIVSGGTWTNSGTGHLCYILDGTTVGLDISGVTATCSSTGGFWYSSLTAAATGTINVHGNTLVTSSSATAATLMTLAGTATYNGDLNIYSNTLSRTGNNGSGLIVISTGSGVDIYNNTLSYPSGYGIYAVGGSIDASNVKIRNNAITAIETTVVLSETPTATTWNAGGTIMTNASALWNTAGAGQVFASDVVYIISGTNATVGNYVIQSVDSNTQITLTTPIGASPSNVNYAIYKAPRWGIYCYDHWDYALVEGNTAIAHNCAHAGFNAIAVGLDGASGANAMSQVICRNNKIGYTGTTSIYSHGLLIGEGADNAYVSGNIVRLPDEASSSLNIAGVIKADYATLINNSFVGYRGLYLKGASDCKIINNLCKSFGTNAFETITDSGNVPARNTVLYNIIDGSEGTYCINTDTEGHNNNFFDYNAYYYGSSKMANISNSDKNTFSDWTTYWTALTDTIWTANDSHSINMPPGLVLQTDGSYAIHNPSVLRLGAGANLPIDIPKEKVVFSN